jgi:hypothetical protein
MRHQVLIPNRVVFGPSKSEKDCYEKRVTRQLDGLFGESYASLIS